METFSQHSKKWLLYSLIGLSVMGGAYVVSPKNAFASDVISNVVSGGSIPLFNSSATQSFSPVISGTGGGTMSVEINISSPCSNSVNCSMSLIVNGVGTLSSFNIGNVTCPNAGICRISFPTNPISWTTGDTIQVQFTANVSNSIILVSDSGSTFPYFIFVDSGGFTAAETGTHFISVSPANGSTNSTTTKLGAEVYANGDDFINIGSGYGRLHIHAHQPSFFACQNSGAVFDAVVTCAGPNMPASDFNYDYGTSTDKRLTAGLFDLKDFYTFLGGGKWTIEYDIQQVSSPWYLLGLSNVYTTIVSTTTTIVIGQPSPMDVIQGVVSSSTAAINRITQQGIGAILASTTASVARACNIISGGFNIGDCLTLIIWPGNAAINDDFTIVKELPPWGYVFRLVDILNAPISSTTLPTISYDFASSSPMSAIGTIHFDPFGEIQQSGALINEMTSDRPDHLTVWQILMPVVNIFVYLVLAFMVIHDLTGIHKNSDREKDRDANFERYNKFR